MITIIMIIIMIMIIITIIIIILIHHIGTNNYIITIITIIMITQGVEHGPLERLGICTFKVSL